VKRFSSIIEAHKKTGEVLTIVSKIVLVERGKSSEYLSFGRLKEETRASIRALTIHY